MGERAIRPWGSYSVLDDHETHKVKRIEVLPGKRPSYQLHRHRSEHWFVVSGHGLVTIEGVVHEIGPGSAIDIPSGSAHRVENDGESMLVLIEIQHGESFEEDDIVRLADDFGRV